MPFKSAFFVFSLFLVSANSFAGDLFDILQRMSNADQQQNYQGTFILIKPDNLSTLRVTHGNDAGGVWESLEALNGEPRKVVRRNNKVISVFPDRELVTTRLNVEKPLLHRQLPENISQLEFFYSLKRLADDRVANHLALVVDLIPKDKLRYGYRYWIDKDTGMLLRCDLVAEDNTVVEQMIFTSLDYLSESPVQSFDLKQFDHYRQQLLSEPEEDVSDTAPLQWAVNTLPQGFMLMQGTMRYSKSSALQPSGASNAEDKKIKGKKNPQANLLHLVYSDGLASVSVFIEKNQGAEKHLQGASTMGAVNAFGNSIDDYFVTVVGEVPVKTVQAMAQSTVKLK
ncbi:Sigma factor RpoE negative regulatory protein RseB precursor [hydrothermal vent metagenome]|uniref:Sigma factor RpoE negative regulatory protein RseB n=1 Tax=hydrothermal vent metagenome TaxID=652676 RepID=A0A3B0WJG6_9ZZZZ